MVNEAAGGQRQSLRSVSSARHPLSKIDGALDVSKTTEHHARHRYPYPVLARLWQSLVVLREAPVSSQPAERPLDYPSPSQDCELVLPLQLRHDLQPRSRPEGPRDPLDELAGVSSVSPYDKQPGEVTHDCGGEEPRAIPVLDVCRMDHYAQEEAERIDKYVPLPPLYLLPSVVTTYSALLRRLDRLAVDD